MLSIDHQQRKAATQQHEGNKMSAIEIQKAEYCTSTQSKTNYIYSSNYFNSEYSIGRIERKYDDKNEKRFVGYRLIIGSDDLCFDDVFFVIGCNGIKRACLNHTKQQAKVIVGAYTAILSANERS